MKSYFRTIVEIPALLDHPASSREKIVDYQNRKLRRLVRVVYENVPFYRKIFDKNKIKPEDIQTLADLSRLPVTTKAEIRAHPPVETLHRDAKRGALHPFKTTGSTGEPFEILRSSGEEILFHVLRKRILDGYGLRRRDRMLRIGTRAREQMPWPWRLAQCFGLFRQDLVHLLNSPESVAADVLRLRPAVPCGNAGVITKTSAVLARQGKKPSGVRFVVTGAEVLTPAMRRQISEAFGARVYDTYESQELGPIAWECRETGLYHVCDDGLLVEILRDGSPVGEGEEGEVVATALHSWAMPLLRFSLGDRVTKGPVPCPCGSPFSSIAAIQGRMTDYLLLPGGRELFASAVAYIVHEHAPWIARYELEQENERSVVLRTVPLWEEPQLNPGLKERIISVLGPGVDFRLEFVRDIKPGPGGKFRVFRSRVRSYYDGESGKH